MIYLASQSPRRKTILKKMGVPFHVVSSRYRERMFRNISPRRLSLFHAVSKALKANVPAKARFVLGADTVVWCRRKILGKPKTKREAIRTLDLISGRTHTVYTGVAIWDLKRNKIYKGVAATKVRIKRLSERGILDYLNAIHPFDKAGSYAIQEGPNIIERIDGSRTNVMGLPAELVRHLLHRISK